MTSADQPQDVRPGEELALEPLRRFFEQALPGTSGPLEIRQFPAGFSNLTYLAILGGREWVVRRPPFGKKPKSGHDMGREYRVLSSLQGHLSYAPKPLALCEDESILGAPFYVMERVPGVIIRRDLPPSWRQEPRRLRRVCERLVDALAEIHSVDLKVTGLSDLGRAEGYVERQVLGWCKRYRRSRTDDVPDCERVMAELVDRLPAASSPGTLIHNDYKLDNVVFRADEPHDLVGVLDWEMATVGDPAMDLGCTLAYWVEAGDSPEAVAMRVMPTHLEGALTRAEVVERYQERHGSELPELDFYHAFGLFRLAVIVQQIYYRFVQGQTRDPRFADLGRWVRALEQSARRVLAGARP